MRLESALFSSREGLIAQGQALAVVGDNISNANTPGYKVSRVEFSDLFAGGIDSANSPTPESGAGAKVQGVRQIHEPNVLDRTDRTLDVGIAGSGYFITSDGANTYYTRAGIMNFNEAGELVDGNGYNVQGYAPGATQLSDITKVTSSSTGTVTSFIGLAGNLDASAAITAPITNVTSYAQLQTSAQHLYVASSYDSLGAEHKINVAFNRTGSNEWVAQAYIDGEDVGGTKGVPVQLGSNVTMTFGPNGAIATTAQEATKIVATPAYSNGSDAGNFELRLGSYTQFSASTITNNVTTDGVGSGNVTGYQIGADGTVVAQLDNGQKQTLGTIILADFVNRDGLDRIGANNYVAGSTVGEINQKAPGDDGFGKLESGSLERSSVDLADQFINLVTFQRGYQANSQTLSTANDLLKATIQLMR